MKSQFPAMADSDTAITPRSAKALVKAGYTHVGRYTRAITKAEAEVIWAAGLFLVLIIESTETESFGGQDAGRARYTHEVQRMRALLDWPADRPLYLTTDRNTATIEQTEPYYQGAHDAAVELGQAIPGGYGPKPMVKALKAKGIIGHAWGVNSWPHTEPETDCDLIQMWPPVNVGGIEIDHNNQLTADIGGYNPAHPPTPPRPPAYVPVWAFPYPGHWCKRGDSAPSVKQAAIMLRYLGYHGFNVSVGFGTGKEIVVRRFQRNHHLPITGVIDQATWDTLAERTDEVHAARNKAKG